MDRFVKVAVPVVLSGLLVWYLASGQIYLYVHERTAPLIALSIPVLLLMAFVHFRHKTATGLSRLTVALVALPLIVGIAVPGQPLGAAAIDNQSAASAASSLGDVGAGFTIDAQNATWDLRHLSGLRANDPSLHGFAGQRASLIGFVYRAPSMPPDQFLVSRFVIRCCTADAVAVSFPVHYARAAELPRDTWVTVDGAIQTGGTPDKPIAVVEADQVTIVPQPSQPYLY